MTPYELWLLLALAVVIGGLGGSLIGGWLADRQCCDCCTCEDCIEWDDEDVSRPGSDSSRLGERGLASHQGSTPWAATGTGPGYYDTRRTVVLEPGPTIYPELRALAEQALDGSTIDADRPDTGTWMRTLRIRWESEYPIPGTPQWDARHPVGIR